MKDKYIRKFNNKKTEYAISCSKIGINIHTMRITDIKDRVREENIKNRMLYEIDKFMHDLINKYEKELNS